MRRKQTNLDEEIGDDNELDEATTTSGSEPDYVQYFGHRQESSELHERGNIKSCAAGW